MPAAAAALLTLAGCALEGGPPGGERPAMAAVPERPDPRYDAFERAVLRDALEAARHEARRARAVAAARQEGRPVVPPPALPPPPALAPADPDPPPPPPTLGLEDNLVDADGLVALATAVGRDRLELARRARIQAELDEPSAPPPRRVTVLAFAPSTASVGARERERLERALAAVGTEGAWLVRTGGALAERRATAAREALLAAGIDPAAIETASFDRDVDVAEIAVRR